MKKIVFLLLFFCPLNVFGKILETPYIKVGECNFNYEAKDNERVEKVVYYIQEKKEKKFKYLDKPNKDYPIKSEEFIYLDKVGSPSNKNENVTYDRIKITNYYYQELKKINFLNIDVLEGGFITNIVIKASDEIIYQSKKLLANYNIKFDKFYSPADLTIKISFFLNQDYKYGSFNINNLDYINKDFYVYNKGYNIVDINLINELNKTMYDKKVKRSNDISNQFYIKVLKKKSKYYYLPKYYKCYEDSKVVDSKIKDGYQVIGSYEKYYLYRKEKIELFDNIELVDYFDLDKVIKFSSIPYSKINFRYNNNCGKGELIIKYQNYEYKCDINFKCSNFLKSKVKKGKEFSFFRLFVVYLVKCLQIL